MKDFRKNMINMNNNINNKNIVQTNKNNNTKIQFSCCFSKY